MNFKRWVVIGICAFALTLSGCGGSSRELLRADASQVQLRNIQTRAFDTNDKRQTLRVVIATLQDLGFVIDRADDTLGTVSATKLSGYRIRITVSVRPKGEKQLLVRANAEYNLQAIEDPKIYQNFFVSLGKALFLEAHSVQ